MTRRSIVEPDELRERLREAEQTLWAIRNGEVDSLVVSGPQGDQVFSLKGAEQPYRIFVEQMLEGAVTLAEDGTILYCNRRFSEMMQSRLEKVIGAHIQSFLGEEDHNELAAILANPAARKMRFRLAAADGTVIPAQMSFSQMPMEDGVKAICVVVTDLTEQEERRELATALQNLREAQTLLERRNEELVAARSEAEAANEAKDKFLAALSHELRTPLTPVLLTISEIEDDNSLSAQTRKDLSIVRRNVELEARLIDDLLDLTRIARGKLEIKTSVVDMHALLSSAIDICRSDITAKHIIIENDLHATNSTVVGDAVRLQQVLWNLLRNAVKFTPDGGKIILLSQNEHDTLKLTISDTGIGIDSAAIDRIFNPFEQANRLITQQFGGLGLGLAISKRLAEIHGGTITAHSDGPAKGATFDLILPSSRDALQPDSGPSQKARSALNGRLRILLIEDHDDTRRSLSRLLGRSHAVNDVGTVQGALAAAEKQEFDLVISDLGLPDGSGLDLMKRLHDAYGLPGVCLSGFGMEHDLARSARAGFRHHLTKPVDLSRLESIINSFLPQPRSA